MKTELIIALDYPSASKALALAETCKDLNPKPLLKIGLQLYVAEGPTLIKKLKQMGFKIFLDLKFYDIPNTVASAIQSAITLGVDIIDIHLSGGEKMAKAAVNALNLNLEKTQKRPLLFGVTILTSEENTDPQKIVKMAQNAKDWGLDGVVCSAMEATAVKEQCGNNFLCLTPGIRLANNNKDDKNHDQVRVMTPQEAIKAGSNFLVVGRPITQAENPKQIVQEILTIISNN
ncbi:orotidine-5'-phosphate decarboxylase [Desulfovibrio litoralis]|uniref:Orotidine 5'-phosphate decarboxylase n=1 Tax=Desulfovibrio litoralis DSM 11393 TaxID=1121455 RepID=A0A1M7SG38_9BACT|nr:orotidine-5'-phosphate decarboxylase [Desulfovibrio litoralis]SHN57390.1 orotidine-5'-phosphate decarboxylase [Desulfovibrio litoralis DSM 11393]